MNDAKNIINDVAEHYGITLEDLQSSKRKRPLPDARAIIFWLLCFSLNMSTTEAGKQLNRDHSTVVIAIRKVEDWFTVPQIYRRELNLINNLDQKYEAKETDCLQTVDEGRG